jgi:hypothetical protein
MFAVELDNGYGLVEVRGGYSNLLDELKLLLVETYA